MCSLRRTPRFLFVTLLLCGASCNPDGGGGQSLNLGQIFQPRGSSDDWTILCLEVSADLPNHRQTTDNLAASLGQVNGVDPAKIRVDHKADASRLYYGTFRPIDDDESVRFSPEDRNLVSGIRSLAINEVHPFLEARLVPVPTEDVGPADWNARNCAGPYTLEVAEFYNEQGFDERKEAAVALCRLLREEKGYEAYFWHGPRRSVVCVGAFTPNRDFRVTPHGTYPGPKLRELIDQDPELLKYKLVNGGYVTHIVGENKVRQQTRPIPVPGRSTATTDRPQPRVRYEALRR